MYSLQLHHSRQQICSESPKRLGGFLCSPLPNLSDTPCSPLYTYFKCLCGCFQVPSLAGGPLKKCRTVKWCGTTVCRVEARGRASETGGKMSLKGKVEAYFFFLGPASASGGLEWVQWWDAHPAGSSACCKATSGFGFQAPRHTRIIRSGDWRDKLPMGSTAGERTGRILQISGVLAGTLLQHNPLFHLRSISSICFNNCHFANIAPICYFQRRFQEAAEQNRSHVNAL